MSGGREAMRHLSWMHNEGDAQQQHAWRYQVGKHGGRGEHRTSYWQHCEGYIHHPGWADARGCGWGRWRGRVGDAVTHVFRGLGGV